MTNSALETIKIVDPLADFIEKSERVVATSQPGRPTYRVRNEKGDELEVDPIFTEGTVKISYG